MDCPFGSCLPPPTVLSSSWWPHFPHTLNIWCCGRRGALTLLFAFVVGCSSSTRALAAFLTMTLSSCPNIFLFVSLCRVLFVSHTGVVGRAVTNLWVEGRGILGVGRWNVSKLLCLPWQNSSAMAYPQVHCPISSWKEQRKRGRHGVNDKGSRNSKKLYEN